MPVWSRWTDLLNRLASYSPWEVVVEFALIWVIVYIAVRFVQGTRAAGAFKGLLLIALVVVLVSRVLGGGERFERMTYLVDKFLTFVAVGLIVIFQPELRRALVRLGETPFFRGTPPEIAYMVQQISEAARYLSRAKFGGLIVIERGVPMAGIVEGGTRLGAELSSQLLQTIFFPGSALHDLAVVVKGRTIHSAGVQLPLAEAAEMPDEKFGSRHRAALGVSKESDAVVVVVSEETGTIRLAERGRLSEPIVPDELPAELRRRLVRVPVRGRGVVSAVDHGPPAVGHGEDAAAGSADAGMMEESGEAMDPGPDRGADADGVGGAGSDGGEGGRRPGGAAFGTRG
ncbi:MAG: diadenylate cyclase [Phycisphaeraceae bacterium]|nr:MAG: diadenylate cyclase [Phycisphaeraceae bacterium]